MSANSRLTLTLHILARIAYVYDQEDAMTSEQIASSVNTNPVVIRRLLGMLEKARLVHVRRGTGAGWKLARRPEDITARDVYRAVEPAQVFPLHHTPPSQTCPIGRGIRSSLQIVYSRVENVMEQELAAVTIADILDTTLQQSVHTTPDQLVGEAHDVSGWQQNGVL